MGAVVEKLMSNKSDSELIPVMLVVVNVGNVEVDVVRRDVTDGGGATN